MSMVPIRIVASTINNISFYNKYLKILHQAIVFAFFKLKKYFSQKILNSRMLHHLNLRSQVFFLERKNLRVWSFYLCLKIRGDDISVLYFLSDIPLKRFKEIGLEKISIIVTDILK